MNPDEPCATCGLRRKSHWGPNPLAAGVCDGFKGRTNFATFEGCLHAEVNGFGVQFLWLDGFEELRHLVDLLGPYSGKKVRISVEVVE